MANPTLQLKGRLLPNGWLVKELIAKGENDTGGHFSVQYEVEKEGKRFFLKAIDIYRTLQDVPLPNITTKLDEQLSIYNFENKSSSSILALETSSPFSIDVMISLTKNSTFFRVLLSGLTNGIFLM